MYIAIALHLYTCKLLPSFREYLQNIPLPYDLFITTTDDGEIVRTTFPDAKIYPRHVNRGMDIGGFLTVLPDIMSGSYNLVLKLHSKSNPQWFADLMDPICGSVEKVSRCLDHFQDPSVGAVGSQLWLRRDENDGRGSNTHYISELGREFSQPLIPYSFIGGTIFWMRVEPLRKVFRKCDLATLVAKLNTPTSLDWHWYKSFYPDLQILPTSKKIIQHWNVYGRSSVQWTSSSIKRTV